MTAANGMEAMQKIREQPFDVVITDLKMEQADGMQVLDAAKQQNPDTEVIIITGYATGAGRGFGHAQGLLSFPGQALEAG